MKTWKNLFVLAALLPGAVGCWSNDTIDSSDVNEDKLFGDYEGTFTAESSAMHFVAQLTVGGSGGTTVRLLAPSELRLDDQLMPVHDGTSSSSSLMSYRGRRRSVSAETAIKPCSRAMRPRAVACVPPIMPFRCP